MQEELAPRGEIRMEMRELLYREAAAERKISIGSVVLLRNPYVEMGGRQWRRCPTLFENALSWTQKATLPCILCRGR